jgi:hypothetical protein
MRFNGGVNGGVQLVGFLLICGVDEGGVISGGLWRRWGCSILYISDPLKENDKQDIEQHSIASRVVQLTNFRGKVQENDTN